MYRPNYCAQLKPVKMVLFRTHNLKWTVDCICIWRWIMCIYQSYHSLSVLSSTAHHAKTSIELCITANINRTINKTENSFDISRQVSIASTGARHVTTSKYAYASAAATRSWACREPKRKLDRPNCTCYCDQVAISTIRLPSWRSLASRPADRQTLPDSCR